MANICEYRVIVKGKKNACYALYGSMPVMDGICIVNEYGTNEDYTIHFVGSCAWYVDHHVDGIWLGKEIVTLPEDSQEARAEAVKYARYSLLDRTKIFGVEVFCNSVDIDGAPNSPQFVHYVNGEWGTGICPEEIEIDRGISDGYEVCPSCGIELPIGEMCDDGSGQYFCTDCYEEIYG